MPILKKADEELDNKYLEKHAEAIAKILKEKNLDEAMSTGFFLKTQGVTGKSWTQVSDILQSNDSKATSEASSEATSEASSEATRKA